MNIVTSFLISLATFIALDVTWLGVLMKDFYTKAIPATRTQPLVWLGIIVWVLIVFGIYYFALPLSTNWSNALLNGALYGFLLYSVYELTNYIYLASWPLSVVLIDIAWGSILCAVISVLSFVLQKK
ncbi:membrane protein [Candidatus Dependentiae bacterium Noda2021]|nr:membrane protein [Candidatus Dependentiae bacterium Noda2021]